MPRGIHCSKVYNLILEYHITESVWRRYTNGQLFLGAEMGSSGYGAGKGRLLQKELMVVLMHRYDSVMAGEGHLEVARGILDALADLMRRRNLSRVVETLEICGIISHAEARHFLGADSEQQVIEEAGASSGPHPRYFVFSNSKYPYIIAAATAPITGPMM